MTRPVDLVRRLKTTRWLGRIGPGGFRNLVGLVESGRVTLTRSDPGELTRPVKSPGILLTLLTLTKFVPSRDMWHVVFGSRP